MMHPLRNLAIAAAISVALTASANGQSQANFEDLDRAFVQMPMKEFGQLSLYLRHEILRPFKAKTQDRPTFDACMIGAAADPRTWSLTVPQAITACLKMADT